MCKNNLTNVYITDDITIDEFEPIEFDTLNVERYNLTPKNLESHYRKYGHGVSYEEHIESIMDYWPFEDIFHYPAVNTLYYFPRYVFFKEEDRDKVAPDTTLLYDTELKVWAVAMTSNEMDLSPNLLDTFLKLGKGIPMSIAKVIKADYAASIPKEKHLQNCQALAYAFDKLSGKYAGFANRLRL